MRTFLLSILLLIGFFSLSQSSCVTFDYIEKQKQLSLTEAEAMLSVETFLKKGLAQKQGSEDLIILIPVVVHVLYNNASQNISDVQIRSGLEALNRDFRRNNADTVNTPQRFRSIAADVQIEFYLATADPLGRATSGIVRKQTARNGWMADDKMKRFSTGGDDAWDSKSYLNIWIVNLIGGSGYSSVPGSAAETDGIVINFGAFGTINTAAPFNMGRTAVHEVGHWLGLKHIWGDASCGDDGVEDTPTQSFFTTGCPSGFRSSCNNGTAGDMYMNYMDYTNDNCMNLFTEGQRNRMRSLFAAGGPRASLLQSKGLNEPWLNESPALPVALLYPNPAREEITIQVGSASLGKRIHLYNSQGQLLKVETVVSMLQIINITNLKAGVYFLKGEGYLQRFIKL